MTKKSEGIGTVVVIAVSAALIFIGLIAWAIYAATHTQKTDTASQQSSGQSNGSSTTQIQKLSMLGGTLELQLPAGWTKRTENQVTRTIDDQAYAIYVQPSTKDPLVAGGSYARNMNTIISAQTSKANAAYIVTASGEVAVSACLPSADNGCSFTFKDKPLLIMLAPYTAGETSLNELDLKSAQTKKAIDDFSMMVRHLAL